MANFCFPEDCKIVLLYKGAANAVACDIVSCKNANKVWFFISHSGTNDTDLTLQLAEAQDVAGTGVTSVTVPCPIWEDIDSSTTSDALVRSTDDDNIVIDPATEGSETAVIEWDPAKHTEGFDCITLTDSGGHASNSVHIYAVIDTKFKDATPPSAIID